MPHTPDHPLNLRQQAQERDDTDARARCEAKGDRWDPVLKKCIVKPETLETTGRIADLPDGRTFIGLNRQDIEDIKANEAKKNQGTQPLGTTQAREDVKEERIKGAGELFADDAAGQEAPTEGTGVTTEDITTTDELGRETTIPAGTIISSEQAQRLGLTSKNFAEQEVERNVNALAIGASATPAGLGTGLATKTGGFLSRVFARTRAATTTRAAGPGSRALGTNPRALGTNPRALLAKSSGVLQAPGRAAAIKNKITLTNVVIVSSLFGLGRGTIATALTGNIGRLETETSKLGEQLTKIPEAARNGFALDDDENLFEYTDTIALAEVADIKQTLFESQRILQTAGIRQTILKLGGRYRTTQSEIDKQLREVGVAEGKIFANIANPSPALENTRDLFRQFTVDEAEDES